VTAPRLVGRPQEAGRRRAIAALATLACTAVVGAQSAASAPTRTLHVGLVQQPNSLDPLHAVQFFENYLAEATFSALTVIDDRGNVAPDLAEAVPTRTNGGISADGRTITYRLRPNARWSDGVPLTSADVRFTFDLMRAPTTNFPESSLYAIVARIDTPDPRTVVLHLRAPWADATSQLFVGGQSGSIVPEHVLAHVRDLGTSPFESAPVGSGPYVVERWDRGNRIVLRANTAYFRGPPSIERIEVDFVPDQTVLAVRLRTHELDFSPQLTPLGAMQLATTPGFAHAAVPTFTDAELVFNVRRPPFDDARLRRALALAVDRAELVRTVYHGYAEVADDLVPSRSPFHHGDPALRANGDLARAAALLDAAGWRVGANGTRTKNGVPLTFALTVPAGYAAIEASAVQLQATWKSLGVDATLRPILSNQLYATGSGTMPRGDFTASLTGDGYATSPDRADTLTTAGLPPGRNDSRFTDPDVDRWTLEARRTLDDAARGALYAKISKRVLERAALVPLVWTKQAYAWNDALLGLRPEPVNSDFWNVYEWRWK
jgi:peptide/nickel transport system substrate-binding protein